MANEKYPRTLAVQMLTKVLNEKSFFSHVFEESIQQFPKGLTQQSKRWLFEVVSGTLRWKGRLDWIIDQLAFEKKPSGRLRKNLLIALYQLIVQTDAPVAQIVSEVVEEIKKRDGIPPSRFANACLRKVVTHLDAWKNSKGPQTENQKSSKESIQAQANWNSLPEWLWVKLVQDYGEDWARNFAQSSLNRPELWISSRSSSSEMKSWTPKDVFPEFSSGPLSGSWKCKTYSSDHLPSESFLPINERVDFSKGQWIVQDLSSQILVKEMSEEVKKSLTSIRALDLCAAPGGKSIALSWNGISVIATDHSEKRIHLLKESIHRAAPEVFVLPFLEAQAEKNLNWIWIDAPCSGTGTLRKNPEIRWIRSESDLNQLKEIQKKLVLENWTKLPVGGFLSYTVCSVLKEEGIGILESIHLASFIQKSWNFAPHEDYSSDGFYGALLKKTE